VILDGRNRYKACLELGIEPDVCELEECDDPVAYVISTNLHRRHLTKAQWAAIAVEYIPMLAAQAAERKREHGGTAPGKHLGKELPKCSDDGKATEQAAKLTGTNRTYVATAKKLKDESPEVFEEMKSGKLTVPQAVRKANGKPEPTGERKKKDPAPAPRQAKATVPQESNVIGDVISQLNCEFDCATDSIADYQLEPIARAHLAYVTARCKARGIVL